MVRSSGLLASNLITPLVDDAAAVRKSAKTQGRRNTSFQVSGKTGFSGINKNRGGYNRRSVQSFAIQLLCSISLRSFRCNASHAILLNSLRSFRCNGMVI
jgi:hypothetical protein